ncbi:putative endoglucanase [Saccharicrinis fermentans DSM 9555 = JCM 21142]|uniref:Putative endoglucanase n=2 Tax=Saccharicrinis fermentans TaxID=982 RepID=W7Y0D6_9BACT|nr:putative endoglucanase [Saccharicrinis fermentans DSM 9555 = JCM 21142]
MKFCDIVSRVVSTVVLCVVWVPIGYGQIKVWKSPSSNNPIVTSQWEVNDLVYKVKRKVEKPFLKEVFARVEGGQKEQRIPLFYNGNNEWVFRYSSAEIGDKHFAIESDIKGLNGIAGKIIVTENKKTGRHGGIVLNKEKPRDFFHEDGTHYFNLAFECDWLFALDYPQEDLAKTTHLLSLIKANGYNQIVMNVYAYGLDLDWVKDEGLKKNPQHNYGCREDIFPFLGSNEHPDYSSLNIDFFKHLDRVISKMHDYDIVSHLMIYVWNKRVSWPALGSEADDMYYKHVIERYQAFPNIVWDVSKEAASKIAFAQNKNIVEHLIERAQMTRALDAYGRLLTVHDFGFCKNHKEWVDFISIQNWKLDLYDLMLKAYKEFPDKPVFNIEHGGYEESPYAIFPGGYSNAEYCLRRNYLCLFAGVYTTYYWQGTSWNAIIHNPFEQGSDVKKPHFEYFKYMRSLFNQVNYENFEPVTKFNSRSYNLTNYKDGMILLYVPKEVHHADIKNQLDNEFNYDSATCQWFNTLTGEFTPEEKVEFKHKYGFWDWRPWRNQADAIYVIRGLEKK